MELSSQTLNIMGSSCKSQQNILRLIFPTRFRFSTPRPMSMTDSDSTHLLILMENNIYILNANPTHATKFSPVSINQILRVLSLLFPVVHLIGLCSSMRTKPV